MSTPFDVVTAGKLAALHHRTTGLLTAARPLLTKAPDKRPATDNPIADPTADTVLHPARLRVSAAFRRAVNLHHALLTLSQSSEILAELEAAIDEWNGAS